MKILFVLENYYPHIGGVETLFKSLCESLVAKGHDVTVFTSRVIKGTSKNETVNGVEIRRFWSGNRYVFTFLSILAVWRLARKNDHVHTTSYNAALPAWVGARLAGRSCTITFHEVWDKLWLYLPWMSGLGARLHRVFEKMILSLGFDRFIGVSQSTVDRLVRRVGSDRVQLIYNGLDYREIREYKINSDVPVDRLKTSCNFIYVGRLGVSKGLDLLIPAFASHIDHYPQDKLKLVVPKQPKGVLNKLSDLIKEYSVSESVTIIHELSYPDLCRTMQQSDAIVIPSYSEGFCFVAADAVALEVPIISSGQTALQETVSGKYIEMNEFSVRGLAYALAEAHKGNWSFKHRVEFPLNRAVSKYTELFSKFQYS